MNKTKYDNNESAVFYKPIAASGIDLIASETGYEKCDPGHAWGPEKKAGHCLHYVISGKGKLVLKDKTFEIHAGQIFYVSPDSKCYYEANNDDPWEYYWIIFNGTISKNVIRGTQLSADNPVIDDKDDIIKSYFTKIFDEFAAKDKNNQLYITGNLYLLFDEITKRYPSQVDINPYLKSIIEQSMSLISTYFLGNLTVSCLAKKTGLCRSQLYRIFMSEIGYSPKEYITRMKIIYAAELIKNGTVSINRGASEVGYNNYNSFSKSFKRIVGVLPAEFVELNKQGKFVISGTYLEFLHTIHPDEEINQYLSNSKI